VSVKYKLNSYTEWSKLKEVIVGIPDNYFYHHLDISFRLFYYENIYTPLSKNKKKIINQENKDSLSPYIKIHERIVIELQEDIKLFISALEDFGINVLRPEPLSFSEELITPFWTSRATPPLNIRDQTLILGNNIIETAPHVRARYFENDYIKPIFYEYFDKGANWISMPKPTLSKDSLDPSYFTDNDISSDDFLKDDIGSSLNNLSYEIVFDGAQCIRLGKDIIVNVANYNHNIGLKWLKRIFGQQYRFHKFYRMADNHIDSIILPLKPGMLLLRDSTYKRFLPEAMKSWEILYPPEVNLARFPSYKEINFNLSSKFIDMNVLSLDEDTVIVNSLYPELIKLLESKKMNVIPVRHRHRRLFGGGFHCFTLDTVREGTCENYFD
jgi:glycine amidinotransferase